MATSKRGSAVRSRADVKKMKSLEEENEKLRATIGELKAINGIQLQKLVNQELLKTRIKELEYKLSRKIDD